MEGSLHSVSKSLFAGFVLLLLCFVLNVTLAPAQTPQRLSLDEAVVLVDSSEASYLQYGAKDLASYLTEITGKPISVSTSASARQKAKSIIAIGEKMAVAMGADLGSSEPTSDSSVIRSLEK